MENIFARFICAGGASLSVPVCQTMSIFPYRYFLYLAVIIVNIFKELIRSWPMIATFGFTTIFSNIREHLSKDFRDFNVDCGMPVSELVDLEVLIFADQFLN